MAFNWAAAGQMASAGTGIVAPLLNIRANKMQQERANSYNQGMYERERSDNRADADKQWARELDIKAQMDALKQGGINPYAIMGQSYTSPSSASNSAKPFEKADVNVPDNFGQSIAQIPIIMAQQQLIQAQTRNIEADTAKKTTETSFIAPQAETHMTQLQEQTALIKQQQTTEQGKQAAIELENLGKQISNRYTAALSEMELESKTQQNRESQQRIQQSKREMQQLDILAKKLQAETEKLNNDIKIGNLSGEEIKARTNAINAKLEAEIKEIERRGYGLAAPIKGILQEELSGRKYTPGAHKIDSLYNNMYHKR